MAPRHRMAPAPFLRPVGQAQVLPQDAQRGAAAEVQHEVLHEERWFNGGLMEFNGI